MMRAQGSIELLILLAGAFAFICTMLFLANSLNKEAGFELERMDARVSKALACDTAMDERIKFQAGEYFGGNGKCGANYRLYHQKISTMDSRIMK